MRTRALALLLSLTMAALPARSDTSHLEQGRQALRARQFEQAIAALDRHMAGADTPNRDESVYLKALALFYSKQYVAAVAAVDRLLEEYPESAWRHKASFAKARALIEQRKFREAETIYEQEANRLLSEVRKREIAGVIVGFADALARQPDPDELDAPPPDYGKAYNLYKKALDMEIGRTLRDEVMFKRARAIHEAGNHNQAIQDYRAWLDEFDPDWTGPVGSAQRMRNQKKENPPPRGKRVAETRHHLVAAQLAAGRHTDARENAEDLIRLLTAPGDRTSAADTRLVVEARRQIVSSYRMPSPAADELERGIKAARDFLAQAPDHPYAVAVAWWIAEACRNHGRSDEAVRACEAFIAAQDHRLPAGDAASAKVAALDASPVELADRWQKQALFNIGQIRMQQKQYVDAVDAWERYVKRYPNGPHWAQAQAGIVNAEFQVGIDLVADRRYEQAMDKLIAFITAHPLDNRNRQVLFLFGQIHFQKAQDLKQNKADDERVRAAFHRAVDQWDKLVSRFPNTDESSLALFRIGEIHENELDNLEAALTAYRRLKWGSWAGPARGRIEELTRAKLVLRTERKYRTDETPQVTLDVRNVKKITMRRYALDLEACFRKTHGITGIEQLDIALIQPDKTWEVEVKDYAKYKPITQEIDVPFAKSAAGVCLVSASSENWEATTLLVRSDLDLIVKTSRREVLVFVQDMRTGQPAPGVKLLLSDGKEVFATARTGRDGVYRDRHDQLRDLSDVRVFAVREGAVAANVLNVRGMELSSGLAARGYIYTDRSAYQPGHTVALRGIIRDVKDGSYHTPEGRTYVVSVMDPKGRMVWQEELATGRFGTFDTKLPLDGAAPLGEYAIRAAEKDNDKAPVFSGRFLVQRFQLQNIRLAATTPRRVYFRGEPVELTIRAEYYWGEPAGAKSVRYTLPDGRSYTEKTDEEGKLTVRFDTAGMRPDSLLSFHAAIEDEKVSTSHSVRLARLGYRIAVAASQALALAGEPFDVILTASDADGEPVSKQVTLKVLRRKTYEPEPVLAGVPWLHVPDQPADEVTLEEHTLTTDEETGRASATIKVAEGGAVILRAGGEDRFGNTVVGETHVTISGDEDAVKLRIFAETSVLQVGRAAAVRVHSRLDNVLALVTFEGEEIISHRVMPVRKGFNSLALDVGHEHFPNFRVAITLMDGRELRQASKPFTVERELKVAVEPLKDRYLPGAKGKVRLHVTDQLGKPVQAELSLAIVDEALFALFPDLTPAILDFFQAGAKRHAVFRTASTCAFAYHASTRRISEDIKAEEGRLLEAERESGARSDLMAKYALAGSSRGSAAEIVDSRRIMRGEGKAALPAAAPAPSLSLDFSVGKEAAPDRKRQAELGRRELPEAGLWFAAVVTDEDGEAVLEVALPEKTTQWRLSTRGATVETLVGQATARTITRKDFFVTLKTPHALREGDKVRVVTRLHNLTDYSGAAELTLTVRGGDDMTRILAERTRSVNVGRNANAETVFEAIDLPAALRVAVEVTARATGAARGEDEPLADALRRVLPVRPWGLEYASHRGGETRNDTGVTVTLPAKIKYQSQWMDVYVGPTIERAVIDAALEDSVIRPFGDSGPACCWAPARWGGNPGSDLLAVAAALEYARAVKAPEADGRKLMNRARALVQSAVVTQHGNGGWATVKQDSSWRSAAVTLWALSEARKLGLGVEEKTVQAAVKFLQDSFRGVAASDNDARAVIAHALSTVGQGDFAHANRLYRERNSLSNPALAYTALAFVNLQRKEFAVELADLLLKKGKQANTGDDRRVMAWPGSSSDQWLKDEVETTALVALLLSQVRPQEPRLAEAVNLLLERRGCYGFAPAKARGPAVAALAAYFRSAQPAADDYRIRVLVNGTEVTNLTARAEEPGRIIAAPSASLKEGDNFVEFRMEGRGRFAYAVTLRGFSGDLKDPGSLRAHVRSRRYYHDRLAYRGRAIGVNSTSPVNDVEPGQRVRVHVDMYGHHESRFLVMSEPIPAGMALVRDSISCNADDYQVRENEIVFFYRPDQYIGDYSYHLVGHAPGTFRALPAVIRDAMDHGRMRVAQPATLTVLGPGEKSGDPYQMNIDERYRLGSLCFNDGVYDQALEYLAEVFREKRTHNERDLARMLLWIHTSRGFYDAARIVQVFEILRERYPALEIPFDKILVVGRAYRDLGEFERAYLVFRATIDVSFVSDANISAVLEDEGQFLGSIDYLRRLWREYPDTPEVTTASFALSQSLYGKAPQAAQLAKTERSLAAARGRPQDKPEREPTRLAMLQETIELLESFLTLHTLDPLADDAAFSMCNAFLDLKLYEQVVQRSEVFHARYENSEFTSSFRYMTALGHFWQRNYDQALDGARVVATTENKDRDFARYIVGQIYHAQGEPAQAIEWYRKVEQQYPDAAEAIAYFQQKRVSLDEVNIFRPGAKVELTVKYRNIAEAAMQVYRVDLMKLYLREKDLSGVTKVNLAGIEPHLACTVRLGDGKDYVDKEKAVALDLEEEAAYLVIVRGDDLFSSARVLITPLDVEVQEDETSGRVRANVINAGDKTYVANVHVKIVGSGDKQFRGGETDLRGIFTADNVRGKATVIAREGAARYAFYRGEKWLGPRPEQRPPAPGADRQAQPDYEQNLRLRNVEMQGLNVSAWDQMRRQVQKGVQVQQAY